MNLVQRYRHLCESNEQLPELASFLDSSDTSQLPTGEVVALVRYDQSRRWSAGTGPSVESYLAAFPQLVSDQNTTLELLVHEFDCRRRAGNFPDIEEYAQRFPTLANPLRSALTQTLGAELFETSTSQFEELCDDFENELALGNSPELTQWLAKVPPGQRERLFRALLPVELWWLQKRNSPVGRQLYDHRFPEYRSALDDLFMGTAASLSARPLDGSQPETLLSAAARPAVQSVATVAVRTATQSTTSVNLLQQLLSEEEAAREPAWSRFVYLYNPMLMHWARKQGFQDSEAADLTQEAFLKLLSNLSNYRRQKGSSFRSWLMTLLRNLGHDYRRRKSNRVLATTSINEEDATVPDASCDIEEAEFRAWLLNRGLRLIRDDFSEKTWTAFEALVIEGRPANEIARELGITPNSIYLARHRILARLREELSDFVD